MPLPHTWRVGTIEIGRSCGAGWRGCLRSLRGSSGCWPDARDAAFSCHRARSRGRYRRRGRPCRGPCPCLPRALEALPAEQPVRAGAAAQGVGAAAAARQIGAAPADDLVGAPKTCDHVSALGADQVVGARGADERCLSPIAPRDRGFGPAGATAGVLDVVDRVGAGGVVVCGVAGPRAEGGGRVAGHVDGDPGAGELGDGAAGVGRARAARVHVDLHLGGRARSYRPLDLRAVVVGGRVGVGVGDQGGRARSTSRTRRPRWLRRRRCPRRGRPRRRRSRHRSCPPRLRGGACASASAARQLSVAGSYSSFSAKTSLGALALAADQLCAPVQGSHRHRPPAGRHRRAGFQVPAPGRRPRWSRASR